MSENNEVNAVPAVPAEQEAQPEKIVTITQSRFDEVINRAMSRAARETRVEAAAAKKRVTELEQILKRQQEDPDASRLSADLELQRVKAEATALRTEVENARQEKAISAAAKAKNIDFVDSALASRLIVEGGVSYNADSKSYESVDDQGNVIPLAEAVAAFAEKNKFLVYSGLKSGQNSTSSQSSSLSSNSEESLIRQALGSGYGSHMKLESVFGRNSSAVLANGIALRSPQIYLQLKAKAKEKGLI